MIHAKQTATATLEPGEVIRHWVSAGPFYTDVSTRVTGRTLFEDFESSQGRDVLDELSGPAKSILEGVPVAGDLIEWCGQKETWGDLFIDEELHAWGRYYRYNVIVSRFFSTRIHCDEQTKIRVRYAETPDGLLLVAANGAIAVESHGRTHPNWNHVRTLDFDLDLKAGENTLSLGIFRIGRICSGAMRLEVLSGKFRVAAPWLPTIAGLPREHVEAAMQSVRLPQSRYASSEAIRLHVDDCELRDLTFRWVIQDAEGTRLEGCFSGSDSTGSTRILFPAERLAAGGFTLEVTGDCHGSPIGSKRFEAFRAPDRDSRPGIERYEERRRWTLEVIAASGKSHEASAAAQLSLYALNRVDQIDAGAIGAICDHIDKHTDCVDFPLNVVLRLLLLDASAQQLPREVVKRIEETALRFPYWVDEPGENTMVTATENHQILFHAAEIMAGRLWPDACFSNSGMSGAQHIEKGVRLARAWVDIRLRQGLSEWHSNHYYPASMAALLNIYDFSEGHEALRQDAKTLIERMCLALATDHFEGALATVHARCYVKDLMFPEMEPTAGSIWLLYGDGTAGVGDWETVCLATSAYRAPDRFAALAEDRSSISHNEWRQGNANFYVHRTPDYQVSALYDYEPGLLTPQIHPFHVIFADRLPLFFSCPKTPFEGDGMRPDYWSGNASLPRVYGIKDTVMLIFQLRNFAYLTHLYFEEDRYDEVLRQGGWLFARKGGALVGITSFHGMEASVHPVYAGRELVSRARENAWVVELGRVNDYGSLDAFAETCSARKILKQGTLYTYDSPQAGSIAMGFSGPIVHNNKQMVMADRPLLAGTHAHIQATQP